MNQYMAVLSIALILFWILQKYIRKHHYINPHLEPRERMIGKGMLIVAFAAGLCFFVNQYPKSKIEDLVTTTAASKDDWKTYVAMLDADAFCIRIELDGWYYTKNCFSKAAVINRCSEIDFSQDADLNDRKSFVFYVHKTTATNQARDRYYYMDVYDRDDNLLCHVKQLNPDADRQYIAFYMPDGVTNLGNVRFTYEDGSVAFVDEKIAVGYR